MAGNLFHPDATSDLAKFIDATFRRPSPSVRAAFESFCARDNHHLIVLPGSDDHELATTSAPSSSCAPWASASPRTCVPGGDRRRRPRPLRRRGFLDLDVTGRANDVSRRRPTRRPPAIARFVASRVLYRRLGAWVWFPLLALVGFDLCNIHQHRGSLHPPPLPGPCARTPRLSGRTLRRSA